MSNKIQQIIEIITKGAKKSEKEVKGVSSGLKSMAKSAGLAAGAYLGARGLLSAIKSSLTLYAEQQLAEVKLESALGKTSVGLQKYASALQKTTRFGDELIMQGMAQLAFFIKDEKQLKIATKATLDLASAKGMDLVQAADLVAKSVGSSTNALSRYGIAAEGAVGSEERLLSITDEVAKLFGGQAEATTDSYQGSIDQLSNAFGDMQEKVGEKLAPTIQSLAKSFTGLLTESPLDQTRAERFEFEKLTNILINANSSTTSRKKAISDLQEKYPNYISNIDLEKSSTEDLVKFQKQSISNMMQRLELQVREEQLTELIKQRFAAEDELFELEKNKTVGHFQNIGGMTKVWVEGSEKKISNKQKEIDQIQEEIDRLSDLQSKIEETDNVIIEGNNNKNNGAEEEVEILEDYNSKQLARLKADKLEAENKRKFIELYPEQAKALGMINETKTQMSKTSASQAIGNHKSEAESALISKIMELSFPLNLILAATAGKTIDKLYSGITAAQYGADFVTDGPQMMMVGDNAGGREHVSVTPLGTPNLDGPQGQGIVLNIQGNILHESFIEDSVIPQIREGLRLGENIGL
tara:strand:- start:6157 stop:7905 length:1749 start_codon:yes stop_codon:yes gene_type:complete